MKQKQAPLKKNQKRNERRKQRRAFVRQYIAEWKPVCSWCGEDDPATLEFHRHHPVEYSVKKILAKPKSLKAFRRLVKKQTPVCANCHRIIHKEEI